MSADEEAEVMAAIRRVGRLGFAAGALVSGAIALATWGVLCA